MQAIKTPAAVTPLRITPTPASKATEPTGGGSGGIAPEAPQAAPAAAAQATGTLWTTADLARYLQRSERTIRSMLKVPASEPGSIPHVRLPGRAVRFLPDQIHAWVADGCPPAETFARWRRKSLK